MKKSSNSIKNRLLMSALVAVATMLGSANIVAAQGRTVINDGETVTIENETFNSIRHEGHSQDSFEGGAILNNGNLTINNDIFSNNASFEQRGYQGVGHGGAIYSTDKGVLNINNSQFNSNVQAVGGSSRKRYSIKFNCKK